MKNKPFLKVISSALVFSFSSSQLVFAEDPRELLYRAKFAFMDDTRRGGGIDAGTLEGNQTFQEDQMATLQTLQDLSGMNFSLTTQNGDVLQYLGNTLNEIQRPDGTLLRNIELNEEGTIGQADLELSDGSVQVYQNGNVIAYLTPDGTEVYYENGEITHTIKNNLTTTYSYIRDGNGVITQTTLENPLAQSVYDAQGRLTQVTNHQDGSTTFYQNGIILRITLSGGSYYSFTQTTLENQDIQVSLNVFTDSNNNVYSFDPNQNVTHITLSDDSVLTDLVWDSEDNSLQNATLTEPTGQTLYFENQTLTRSISTGGTTTYWITEGAYRGYKEKEVTSQGATSYFEYSTDPQGVISAQRREALPSIYNLTTFQGAANLNYTTNPALRFTAFFPSDGAIDGQIQATATYGTTKNLRVNLIPGSGSSFTFNGATTNLGVNLERDVLYNAEVAWETGQNRIAIYVYEENSPRPTNPQATISDFTWNPKFKLTGTNTQVNLLPASSGAYTRTTSVQDRYNAYQSGSPLERVNFHFNTASSTNKIALTAIQQRVGDITRTLSFSWQNKTWTLTRTDYNNVTKTSEVQTFTVGQQPLSAGIDFVAEIRFEGANINLYVWPQGGTRPPTPIGGMSAFTTGTRFTASSTNASTQGIILRNMTSPDPQTLEASQITAHEDALSSNPFIRDTQRISFRSLTYDSNNNLREALQRDGTRLLFQDNLLAQAFDSNNNPISFNFQESSLSNLLGSSITQNNLQSHYDAQGSLEWVRLDELTIHYNPQDQTIDYIEKEDGTELHDLLFDSNGALQNAEITTPEGEVRTYENGALVSIQRPDTSRLFYTNEQLTRLVTPQALSYNFAYLPDRIEAVIDPAVTIPDALTPIRMQYDPAFNLQQVVRQNNQILNYLDDDLIQIDIPDEAPQVFNYQRDPEGNVFSYTVTQANTESFYDANNNLERVVISPTLDNPHTLEVRYQYGKIREIYKDTTLTFTYSYEFNENNEELTLIEDLEEGTLKTYKDERLLTTLNHETSVLSTYSYEDPVIASPEGEAIRVSRVVVTRLGRELHTYDYSYENNLTIVQDEEQTIRTYDSESQRLLFLEKDHKKWVYSYALQDGQEIVTEDLIQRTLEDGAVIHYRNGEVETVNLPDGSILSNVLLNEDRSLQEATITYLDGSQRTFGLEGLIQETTTDGTRIEYENNRITRITDPDSTEHLYSYEFNEEGQIQSIWVDEGGYRLKYDSEGRLSGLLLEGAPTSSQADLGYYSFNSGEDSEGNVTGYSFQGDLGTFSFDANGNYIGNTQNPIPGALQDFFDSVSTPHTIIPYGNAALDTQNARFGNAAGGFDGEGDYLWIADSPDWDFGTGDFTIEFWIEFEGFNLYNMTLGRNRNTNAGDWEMTYDHVNNRLTWGDNGTLLKTESWTPTPSTWYHVAYVRRDGMLHFYVDGQELGTGTIDTHDITGENPITTGADILGNWGLNGFVDELRISKGVARYTQNFALQGEAFEADSNTALLLHFDNEYQNAFDRAQGVMTGLGLAEELILPHLSRMTFERTLSGGLVANYRLGALYSIYDPQTQSTFYYENNLLSRFTDSNLNTLSFFYIGDSAGHLLETHLDNGQVTLRYDNTNALVGLRINDILNPNEIAAQTTHAYEGGGATGPLSADGSFNTSQYESYPHSSGGVGTTLSEHSFPQNQLVDSVTFRTYAAGQASGPYTTDYEAFSYVETLQNGVWTQVPGSFRGSYRIYGNGSLSFDSGIVTLSNLNLSDVGAIRAFAHGFGNSSGDGSASGAAAIYEIQWSLADQTNYSFYSNPQGLFFQGYEGIIEYDLNGNLLSNPLLLSPEAQSLGGVIQNYLTTPFETQRQRGAEHALPPEQIELLSTTFDSILESQEVISQEYSAAGILETQTKADKSVTLFDENNRPSMVLDQNGAILMEYSYDAGGNPTRVYLRHARDTLPDEISHAREAIESQRVAQLEELALERGHAIDSINAQFDGAIQDVRGQLSNAQNQINDLAGMNVRGRAARQARANALRSAQFSINEGYRQLADLEALKAEQLANLDAQVRALSDQIETDARIALTELSTQETNLKHEILRQEASPIVYDYYRRILGRDPSSQEYENWVGQIDYASGENGLPLVTLEDEDFITALSSFLNNSAELQERQSYVNNIKSFITTAINDYLVMSSEDKLAFAQTLGLSPDELINLTASDAQKILTWLNSRSLHFGQSAFLALEALLESVGTVPEGDCPQGGCNTYNREALAERCILIDILTGVITPLDDGDLVISVYALNKVASLYGLSLSGARLTWENLQNVIASPPQAGEAISAQIIAHINGNHFVVITAITENSITYIDPGIGPDHANESITITKDAFLESWKGNVTLETSLAQEIAGIQNKTLSASQTQNIRGAFWGSLLSLIGSILSWIPIPGLQQIGWIVTTISTVVATIEGDFLTAIANIVTQGLGNIVSAFGEVFDGVLHVLGPIGDAVRTLGTAVYNIYNGVVGFFNSAISFLPGIGPALQSAAATQGINLGAQIVNTALNTGLTIGVSRGLEAIGVSPEIAGFVGQLAAGAAIGALKPIDAGSHITQAQNIQASIQQTITLQQVGQLGLELGLDPDFTNIVALSLSAIQGQFIDGSASNLAEAFSNVLPDVAGSLAQYGLREFAQVIGVSPIVVQAAGLPILSAIGQGIQTGHLIGQNVIQAVNEGLVNGAIAYAADFAADQITDDAILNALSSRVISGAIEGVLIQHDLFRGMYDALRQSVLGAFNLNQQGSLSNPTNFASLILQNGFEGALEIYLSDIFNRQTVESVLRSGGITVALASPKTQITLPDGQSAQMAILSTGEGVLFDAGNNLLGFQRNGIYETGQFGITGTGVFGLVSGKSFGFLPGGQYFEGIVENGNLTRITVLVSDNHLTINPEQGSQGIRFDVEGNIESGSMNINDELNLFVANGYLATIQSVNHIATTTASQVLGLAQSFGDLVNDVFLLRPQTSIFQENGICAADMKLQWLGDLNVMFRDALLTQGLFIAISNYRWVTAIADAVPRIVSLMQDAACRFIFTPGVNSGIRTDTNPTGHTMTEIATLGQSFDIDTGGRRVMFAHSAGTEAQLRAILQAKEEGMDLSNFQFVFASPRVTRTFFESAIQQAGLRPDQVLVVTAAGDWPHWPTDLFGGAPDILPFQGAWDTLMSSFFDYEHNTDSNGNLRYNYLFLEVDRTFRDGLDTHEYLAHGGMVDGAIADHLYQAKKNGTPIPRRRLRDMYADFGNGNS